MVEPLWVIGDSFGLQIPSTSEALRERAAAFLTDAFRASGVLDRNNQVARIVQFEECHGGSTGRKLLLSVAYEKSDPRLCTDLFVKFSRDFSDPIRDRAKIQMESEVRFALLSRIPEFPIAVPKCFFADYHHDSGTGILITDRLAFGTHGIEPQHGKCLDYELPEPLEHYQALIKALGRLAGTHKAGRFPDNLDDKFPFDATRLTVSKRGPLTAAQIDNKVAAYREFAAKFPQLLPANITSPTFLSRLSEQAPRVAAQELAIKQFLHSKPEFVALCHWNAQIDNGWFWRNAQGEIECGLLDWGHASQMNVAMALGGCLLGVETELLDDQLDALLALFATEFAACGAPDLDLRELKLHLLLYIAVSGLILLDAPVLIQRQLPDLARAESRFDPQIRNNERARTQLHMFTVFLHLWQSQDFGKALDEFLKRA
jgi:hypothetical protein